LQRAHYHTLDEQVNYHIAVDSQPLATKITNNQRNKLNKATKTNFIATTEPPEKLSEVYQFIAVSYLTRQRKLSLTLSDLLNYAKAYPSHYLLFSVYHLKVRIAACIAVQVSNSVVYTFYYTALLTYNSYSPTVLLLSHIYRYCQSNNIYLLDLGTGSESTQNFKRRMGGILSYKRSYLLKW
ncbi:MAG: GNAT family N-acetyltransferase, partial [Tunicatimonas sp.]|uniref:GNAT family N-acetyltransferase n=1 Tax=Tunicatimonas sp. TaxID=1940096 RepID=UPI003C76BE77